MTIKEQITALVTALNGWGKSTSSTAEPASDVVHFFGIITRGLSLKPGAIRLAVMFNGEIPRGDIEELGRVDRSYLIGISRGRGLSLQQSDSLIRDTGAGDPMFDSLEQIRETVLAAVFNAESGFGAPENIPYYRGLKRIEIEGMLLDAYQLEIQVAAQIPFHGAN